MAYPPGYGDEHVGDHIGDAIQAVDPPDIAIVPGPGERVWPDDLRTPVFVDGYLHRLTTERVAREAAIAEGLIAKPGPQPASAAAMNINELTDEFAPVPATTIAEHDRRSAEKARKRNGLMSSGGWFKVLDAQWMTAGEARAYDVTPPELARRATVTRRRFAGEDIARAISVGPDRDVLLGAGKWEAKP